jgi:hypothetical protein
VTVPSYPGYPEAAPAPKQRPTIVTVATYLLFLVAALELINAIVALSTYGKTTDAIRAAYEGTSAAGAEGIVGASLIIGAVINILLAGGFAVLGIFDGRGKNPARIVTWVVGGISLCCLGAGLGSSALVSSMNAGSTTTGGPSSSEVEQRINDALPSWYHAVSVTIVVLALLAMLAVIILLALPGSNEFFRRQPLAAGFDPSVPYPPYPGGPSYPGGQYGQPSYPGQPYPGQPYQGQPQQPGGYGQPGQPAPGLSPYPGQPAAPGQPGSPGYPGYPGYPGQPYPGQQGPSYPGSTGSPAYPDPTTGSPAYPGQPTSPASDPYGVPPGSQPPPAGEQPPSSSGTGEEDRPPSDQA